MNTPVKIALTLAALPLFGSYCRAMDEESAGVFFADKETALRQEYLECTGDEQPVDLKFVIGWKKRMDEWKQSPEYARLLRDYVKAVPGAQTVHPCKLIQWNQLRKRAQDSAEKIVEQQILRSNEADDALEELKKNMPSKFDFAGIPFGVSKTAFKYLFTTKLGLPLQEQDPYLYCENVMWDGAAFLTAFFFNDDKRFYKYETESDALPAQYLNNRIRPAAAHLSKALEEGLGPTNHRCNVGFYDIKSGEMAVQDSWADSSGNARVGFSVLDYQYYAKAVVVNTPFSPKAPVSTKNRFQR